MLSNKNIMPFMGVEHERRVKWKNHGTFHIFTYQAYNAMGLIGSECNGIVVCDMDKKQVVCDEIGKADTGYFGATEKQMQLFEEICHMHWEEFKEFINAQPRLRYSI